MPYRTQPAGFAVDQFASPALAARSTSNVDFAFARLASRPTALGRYAELSIEQRVFCLADAAREHGTPTRLIGTIMVRVG